MWQKKNFVASIISEHTLRVCRQSDIYDTAYGLPWSTVYIENNTAKMLFFVKAGVFLVGEKNKLYIYRKICSFDECISCIF